MAIDFMIDGVGDVQIVYYGTSDDLERFKALQDRLKDNLLNND